MREFKRYILEESKPKENDTTEMKLHWEDKKKFAAYYPRLISLKGFKELFEVTGQNSKLKRSQNLMQNEINLMQKELEAMKKKIEEVNNHAEYLHTDALE